jgi:hypothetical protein
VSITIYFSGTKRKKKRKKMGNKIEDQCFALSLIESDSLGEKKRRKEEKKRTNKLTNNP